MYNCTDVLEIMLNQSFSDKNKNNFKTEVKHLNLIVEWIILFATDCVIQTKSGTLSIKSLLKCEGNGLIVALIHKNKIT